MGKHAEIDAAVDAARKGAHRSARWLSRHFDRGNEPAVERQAVALYRQAVQAVHDAGLANRAAEALSTLFERREAVAARLLAIAPGAASEQVAAALESAGGLADDCWRFGEKLDERAGQFAMELWYLLSGHSAGDRAEGAGGTVIVDRAEFFGELGLIPLSGRRFRKNGEIGTGRATVAFEHPLLARLAAEQKKRALDELRASSFSRREPEQPAEPGGVDLSLLDARLRTRAAVYAATALRRLAPALATAEELALDLPETISGLGELAVRRPAAARAVALLEGAIGHCRAACDDLAARAARLEAAVAHFALGAKPGRVVSLHGARYLVHSCHLTDDRLSLYGWRILKNGHPGKRLETGFLPFSDSPILAAAFGEAGKTS